MARIRTIKPELFCHEELFALEKSTGLPIRVAWMGLFTVSDREGRFEWKPNILKLHILPWDQINFAEVLEAFKKAGFIRQYCAQGKRYGYIPTWHLHQRVKSDEAKSTLPTPPPIQPDPIDALPSNEPAPIQTESAPTQTDSDPIGVVELELEKEMEVERNISAKLIFDFDRIYDEYPRKDGKQEGLKHCKSQIKTQDHYDQLLSAVRRYRAQCEKDATEKKFIKHFSSFMSGGKWKDYLDPKTGTSLVQATHGPPNRAEMRSEGNRNVLQSYLNRIGGDDGPPS